MAQNTYYELIKTVKDIFEQDDDVNSVICENEPSQIDNYKMSVYPLVHIRVVSSPFIGNDTTALTRYNMEVTVVNLRDVNKEIINDKFWLNDNRHDNWNLTMSILKTAQNKLVKDTEDKNITLVTANDAEMLEWAIGNGADGWQQTWVLDVPDTITSVC